MKGEKDRPTSNLNNREAGGEESCKGTRAVSPTEGNCEGGLPWGEEGKRGKSTVPATCPKT